MKVLVLVNGDLYKPDIIRNRISRESFDLVIGADAGARHAGILGVKIDIIIGDMDSLSELPGTDSGNTKIIQHPPEKDAGGA